jgi:hypothetical protein
MCRLIRLDWLTDYKTIILVAISLMSPANLRISPFFFQIWRLLLYLAWYNATLLTALINDPPRFHMAIAPDQLFYVILILSFPKLPLKYCSHASNSTWQTSANRWVQVPWQNYVVQFQQTCMNSWCLEGLNYSVELLILERQEPEAQNTEI